MSDQETATTTTEDHDNSTVDALSAVAAVLIPAIAIVYWLSGMPT